MVGDRGIGIVVVCGEYGWVWFWYREEVGRMMCFVVGEYVVDGRLGFDVEVL